MKASSLKWSAAAVAILITFAPAAQAQWVWLNEQGVKQFSDQPPPASVPKNRILKSPAGGYQPPSSQPAAEPAADGAQGNKDKGPMTTAERNADFQKRMKEKAEQEKKTAEAEKLAADKARDCENLRAYARTLEAGERVSRMDPKTGEKIYLNDDQRANDTQEVRKRLANC